MLKKHKEKGSCANNVALIDVIEQVFNRYEVGSVNINERIVTQFRSKRWRIDKAMSKAKGGNQKQRLLENWTNGKLSVWNLRLYYSEVNNIRTNIENDQLHTQKRKLEMELDQMSAKVAKLEAEAHKEHESTQSYKKKFKKICQKLIKMRRKQSGSRGLNNGKKYNMYPKRHQERICKQLTTDCHFLVCMTL